MTDVQTLERVLEQMRSAQAVVVGDVMLDRFVHGNVSRVSAEAPIPVLAHGQESAMLGGAGNVARNIAALGAAVILIGITGADGAAKDILSLLDHEPLIEPFLIVDPERRSTVKMRFLAAGQQLLRVDTESAVAASGDVEARLMTAIGQAAAEAAVILISDYGKGVVTPGVIAACLEAAKTSGAPIIVDSKAHGFAHYGSVDLVKPNAAELGRATNLPTDTDVEVERALERALGACDAKAILVTRAARGLSLGIRGQKVRHASRPPPEVFDTAGAGDTALAALGMALAVMQSFEDAAELALLASNLVVQKAGVATVSPKELLEEARAAQRLPTDSKIVTSEEMPARVARWRAEGLRVGFTNGCFDILHPGHIGYLGQARTWCDRLIVGLNTDDSVRLSKGEERPVNDLKARAIVLAGLAAVDLVVAFPEATPINLIMAARPDVLIKGSDYTLDGVVGRAEVEGWGGEVRLADFMEGHSTTSTLARLGVSR